MQYNWTIPANLTSEVAQYRYLFVKVGATAYVRGAVPTTSQTETLPSTSTGAWFIVMPTPTGLTSTAPTSLSPASTTDPTVKAEPAPEPIPGGLSCSVYGSNDAVGGRQQRHRAGARKDTTRRNWTREGVRRTVASRLSKQAAGHYPS